MKLTPELQSQLEKQVENHENAEYNARVSFFYDGTYKHRSYRTDIDLDGLMLKHFIVMCGVMRPEVMTSKLVAGWLHKNPWLYKGKDVLDLGCGTGILGIVTALDGAKGVTFTDISELAVQNTILNEKQYGLEGKCVINAFDSDLFKDYLFRDLSISRYDLIIFNQPYFPITKDEFDPKREHPILTSMCGGEKLIHEFLEQAKIHLNRNGKICMSFYHTLPDTNDPAVQGPKHGYEVKTMLRTVQKDGLQQGEKSIYLLSLKS